MKEYIRARLERARYQPAEEQKRIIEDIYQECEERGVHHTMVFAWINEIVVGNIKKLREDLNGGN